MAIPVRIVGGSTTNVLLEPDVECFTTSSAKQHIGLVTRTHPFLQSAPNVIPFLNSDFGNNMNQNVSFAGTPERIHNGTDSSLYTFSEPVGTKATEDSTDRANEGIATVVDFNIIDASDSITVDGTELVAGGTNWTAETSNTVTAANIAVAVSAIAGGAYIGSSSGAEVIITRVDGASIATLTTNADAGEMTVETLKAVKIDNMNVNDVFQFAKGSDLTLSNFSAITMWINVDKDWQTDDSIDFYGYDVDLVAEAGNHVALEDYFAFADFDSWHKIVIPLSDLGLSAATTVDAFRFEQIARQGGKSPKFYIDSLQIEQTGAPLEFKVHSHRDQDFHVKKLRFMVADLLDGTVTNGTMPGLSYDKILGVSSLAAGITVKIVRNGAVDIATNLHQLSDMLAIGANIVTLTDDGTNVFMALELEFSETVILKANKSTTSYVSLTINDDLSGLLLFTGLARGSYELP